MEPVEFRIFLRGYDPMAVDGLVARANQAQVDDYLKQIAERLV